MERAEIRLLQGLSDKQLVELSLKGRAAFEEIVQRYYIKVYYLARRMVRTREDAEDITQETFFRAYRCLKQYDAQYQFSNWLLKITTNLAINHLKKHRIKQASLESAGIEVIAQVDNSDWRTERLRKKLEEILDALAPKYRVAFALVHQTAHSYQEAAELMNVPLGTLKTYVYKARHIITSLLQDAEEM